MESKTYENNGKSHKKIAENNVTKCFYKTAINKEISNHLKTLSKLPKTMSKLQKIGCKDLQDWWQILQK